MKAKELKNLSVKELAAYISEYLRKNDIEVVLTGGTCVSIYTKNKHVSLDLDFVVTRYIDIKKIKELLGKIGFKEKGKHLKHNNIEYFIEFIPPPLSVGEETVKKIIDIKVKKYILKLLSPTDCVKDRLAAFYHWNDRQALSQALMVCKEQEVNLNELKRWSKNEGMMNKFLDFKKEFNNM
ncbi:MAG: hypothetical protein A2W05_08235 [Candidatus Schekmanbacteria bacterium RBG_16_38_10]|uniref:Uncharacterized protein n=1 Tax=Candidatus Schekmanbacteria bacterium RBG_16_38_10 TaxID=1817879 RepID=A0A1F7RR49_9BACT|nr:MAG: hypothetical protein A2W05_08235 [Candidatus Schekmanbacteria bacterium RBG_16_38_10]